MIKKLLILLMATTLSLTINSCTSKKTEGEEGKPEAEASAEAGEDAEFADEEGDEVAEGEEAASDDVAEEGAEEGDDTAEATDAGEEGTETAEAGEEGEDDEFAEEGEEGTETAEAGEEGAEAGAETTDAAEATDASEEVALDNGGENKDTIPDSAAVPDTTETEGAGSQTDDSSLGEPTPLMGMVSVKKIAETPYRKAGVLVNSVYLARPGDDIEGISQKIYGDTSKTEELLNVNSNLRNRGVKTGDKVYYNSPRRPTDESKLTTYYEDAGLQPEVYVSQSGDNIRAVSKKLLGDESSWKEIWATNFDVDSKDVIPEGTQLRYWAGASMPASAMAKNTTPQSLPDKQMAPPPAPEEPEMGDIPPPPDMSAANDIPPPPSDSGMGDLPPPPQEPETGAMGSIDAPPPPPPPKKLQPKAEGSDTVSSDPDETMMLGGLAIVLIAAVLLVVMIKKKKQRQALVDFANTQTHTQIE
jgi:hypothetical protein